MAHKHSATALEGNQTVTLWRYCKLAADTLFQLALFTTQTPSHLSSFGSTNGRQFAKTISEKKETAWATLR